MKILTFDIEDWFHLLANESTRFEAEWIKYPSRVEKSMDYIFSVLEENNIKATFFCLGWIAKKYPELIKKISSTGNEIGSHSYAHQLIYQQSPREFKQDLEKSLNILEDITGKKVKYFRAPGFSIKEKNKWAFDIIAECGIEYDSSVFPANRSHGGYSSFASNTPSLIKYNGYTLKEFPINTVKLLGKDYVFSGGGYFRVTPKIFLNNWFKDEKYIMTYFHPRDFDSGQPMLEGLSTLRKFKSYYGIKQAPAKLNHLLKTHTFEDIRSASEKINWEMVPVVRL